MLQLIERGSYHRATKLVGAAMERATENADLVERESVANKGTTVCKESWEHLMSI